MDDIIGHSPSLQHELRTLRVIASSDAPVHIQGESGTGKELVARAIHRCSGRASSALVAQNCAAVAEGLLQSLLFGHKRGSFTGAERDQVGIFEAADGGTLFLDEVADMSWTLQGAVLRAIDSGEVTRVGDTRPRNVNVRVVSATSRDLRREIMSGGFRTDLFYRLTTFEISLPPLRQRDGDVPLLAQHFLDRFNRRGTKNIAGFTSEALVALERYAWPGNVRQLASEVERACVLTPGGEAIGLSVLSEGVRHPSVDGAGLGETGTLREALDATERTLLTDAMTRCNGNKTRAAELLGISRQRLAYRLRRHRLDREWTVRRIVNG